VTRRLALTLALPAAALALPATASAATLAVPPCVPTVPGERTVPVQGSGFTPGSFVRLSADGQATGGATADAAGNIAEMLFPPSLSSFRRNLQTFTLTATDANGVTASVPLQVTRVTATIPDRAKPTSRVAFRVFGFTPGRVVHVHVRRGGKTRGSFRIGRAAGPCGRTSRRLRYMPLRRFSSGTYDYVFQMSSKYDRRAPSVRLRVSITRTIRFG
jgi:hypothetical protein